MIHFCCLVLEASDADNLLEQFEEVPSDFDEENHHNQSNNGNPRKTSNIFKAVQNHFAASAACNDSNSRGGCKRLPRIGESSLLLFKRVEKRALEFRSLSCY